MATKIQVAVHGDHIEKLIPARGGFSAIAELVWNGFDADAGRVSVEFRRNALGGLTEIVVIDSGDGVPHRDAEQYFGGLGGSWKKHAQYTKREHRILHGKGGGGRFKAYALGSHVKWETCFEDIDGRRRSYAITGNRNDDVRAFVIGDVHDAGESPTGTRVTISGLYDQATKGLDGPNGMQRLAGEMALYLRQYPTVDLFFDGQRIDPGQLEAHSREYELGDVAATEDGQFLDAKLLVIEWNYAADRALYMCDEHGFALKQFPARVNPSGFQYTAYVRSPVVRQLANSNSLDLEDMHPTTRKLLEIARAQLRDHFRERAAQKAVAVVDKWKAGKIYPYQADPKTPIEIVERQMFDVLAAQITEHLPDFETSTTRNQHLSLRLLRQALEENPQALSKILEEVLDLPKEKQEELADLLERTTLAGVINASKLVADRLDVIRGLEMILFDSDSKKQLLERTQLHRFVAENTWLFGEEFNIVADDESLEEVLRKHIAILGLREDGPAVSEPVIMDDGRRGIVDIMLSKRIPSNHPEQREHLVIELKRPSVRVDLDVITQVKKYAMAVARDGRFSSVDAKWSFWAVSNEMSEDAIAEAHQKDKPEGVVTDLDNPRMRLQVRAVTWPQVIDAAKARLRFFEESLQYQARRETATKHLARIYGKYMPAALLDSAAKIGVGPPPDTKPAAARKRRK